MVPSTSHHYYYPFLQVSPVQASQGSNSNQSAVRTRWWNTGSATGSTGAARFKDQACVQQALQQAVTVGAADRVDVWAREWLVTLLAGYNQAVIKQQARLIKKAGQYDAYILFNT